VRLLSVINNPVHGGGHVQMERLRAPLLHRGVDTLGVTPAGAPAARRLRAAGVEVVEVPLHRLRATADPRAHAAFGASLVPEVRRLRRLIRERGIDVVQVHGDTHVHGALAAHLEGAAVVWQLYDTRTPPPLRRATMPVVTRVADAITTWGAALGRAYPGTERLGDRWIPVFPPVPDEDFAPPDAAARARGRTLLDAPEGAAVVGAIGNRNPSKGHEYFVRALAAVRERHPQVVGRVLGAASPPHAAYERDVLAEARTLGLDDTAFTMRDGGTRIPALLPGFDVLVLSSVPLSEGMPTVLLEAMACGIPVVATDVAAVRELVVDGETGYVVPPQRPAALADAVLRLLGDASLRRRMGDAGRARFVAGFSLEALADRHLRAYELALAHRAGRSTGRPAR
jgi:glycosyltransferase involved in cell wall biosynthesis